MLIYAEKGSCLESYCVSQSKKSLFQLTQTSQSTTEGSQGRHSRQELILKDGAEVGSVEDDFLAFSLLRPFLLAQEEYCPRRAGPSSVNQ